MRSIPGLAAALVMLLAIPIALASEMLAPGSAETTLHLAIGTASLLLAAAAFDFGVPRWAAWVGGLSAAAFGAIFLLQGLAQISGSEALSTLAFDVLGQELERFLPDVILIWFVVLLAVASHGWTRLVGAAILGIVIAMEVASLAGPLVGIEIPSLKVLMLLPFIWLLLESAKRRPDITASVSSVPIEVGGGAR